MSFPYFPHTQEDIQLMLERCKMQGMEDLYADIPQQFKHSGEFNLPSALSEDELRKFFSKLDAANKNLTIFCGQGAYDHYTPSVIAPLLSRSEFLTAYTPYQAEISQGTLRYIFEYQSYICKLTGLDVSNASMYDGCTAAAEAVMMSVAASKKKNRVLISDTLLPQLVSVVSTYCGYHGIELTVIPGKEGQSSLDAVKTELAAGDVAAVLVPEINRFGIIEDLTGFAEAAQGAKALLILYADPSALAVLKTPAQWGADIACGECQSLGIPLSFGGPYLGYMACKSEYVRKLPGRIVGQTVDVDGKRAFVLTLQAREQHIRREKATSNICSNQSLMALYVTIYLSLMGPEGLREVNAKACSAAHYLHDKLIATGLFEDAFDKPFLNEFALKSSLDGKTLRKSLVDKGFFAATETKEGYMTFCATERRTKEEIDTLVSIVEQFKQEA